MYSLSVLLYQSVAPADKGCRPLGRGIPKRFLPLPYAKVQCFSLLVMPLTLRFILTFD